MTTQAKSFVFFFLVILLLLTAGCAKQHLIQANGDTLVFQYHDDKAEEIILATSQDNFTYHQARREEKNLWIVRLPLANEFSYFYIVDGQVQLPDCPYTVLDDFGGKNCFYAHTM